MRLLLGRRTGRGFADRMSRKFSPLAMILAVATFLVSSVADMRGAPGASPAAKSGVTSASTGEGTTTSDPPAEVAEVLTYHNDAQRSGWNPNEAILTPTTVSSSGFGLLATVTLDGRVDGQPLLVALQRIEGEGFHSVLYVATENNTIYAIDALNGAILKKRTLGPRLVVTGNCSHSVGVYSTPTIDLLARTLYVMSGTVSTGGVPEYDLHALNLETLADRVESPVVVKATQTLQDGTQFTFNASYELQRPALLESDGHIYAAFGSYGDCDGHNSRGWVLGWDKYSLEPLPNNELLNRRPQAGISRLFLSSIWMSGYGPASDEFGGLYFTTGNTEPGTYDEVLNVSESAVRLSNDLGQMVGSFTPANVQTLDTEDGDYGSGGLMVLPDQSGPFPHIAVASGKDGRLFVLNRDKMGGFHSPDIPKYVSIGQCWCGPSYFELPRRPLIVTSGGTNLSEWSITTDKDLPSLSLVASVPAAVESSQHDPGFFTSISSDGEKPGTAIIWAVGHGAGTENSVTLHAFDATPTGGTLRQLWSGVAGVWPYYALNPNVVPTVANGHVYVASVNQIRIFGLLPKAPADASDPPNVKSALARHNDGDAVSRVESSR
jgi:hypothetical protein